MGPLRPDALNAVRAFLRCGDLAAGFTRFHEAGDWRPQAGGREVRPSVSTSSLRPKASSLAPPPPSATKSRTASSSSHSRKCSAASSASAPRNRRETGGCRPEVSHFGRPSLLPPACGLKPQA
jgi:hypothetical protein